MPQYDYTEQKTICWIWFSLSTMWDPGIKLAAVPLQIFCLPSNDGLKPIVKLGLAHAYHPSTQETEAGFP